MPNLQIYQTLCFRVRWVRECPYFLNHKNVVLFACVLGPYFRQQLRFHFRSVLMSSYTLRVREHLRAFFMPFYAARPRRRARLDRNLKEPGAAIALQSQGSNPSAPPACGAKLQCFAAVVEAPKTSGIVGSPLWFPELDDCRVAAPQIYRERAHARWRRVVARAPKPGHDPLQGPKRTRLT